MDEAVASPCVGELGGLLDVGVAGQHAEEAAAVEGGVDQVGLAASCPDLASPVLVHQVHVSHSTLVNTSNEYAH